jgi:ribonuclease HII
VALNSGQKLLRFDRKLGARLVAGTDEAGRGSPAEACLVDGFRLGPTAPEHRAVVDGDEKSAAIAAASIVAKVTRDRLMRRMDALFPHYGFSSHVGYITPGHSAIVRERGPSRIHRRSFQALCYLSEEELAAMSA